MVAVPVAEAEWDGASPQRLAYRLAARPARHSAMPMADARAAAAVVRYGTLYLTAALRR